MAAATPGTGEYKLVLSSVAASNADETTFQLARLLGIEVAGAQMITESVPIILLEGLTRDQATRAGQNTRELRETGAEVQILKGEIGKLRRATWPPAAYGQLVARVSNPKGLPPAPPSPTGSAAAGGAQAPLASPPPEAPAPSPASPRSPSAAEPGQRQLDDALAEIESAAEAVMSEMGHLERTQMMKRGESPAGMGVSLNAPLPAPPPAPPVRPTSVSAGPVAGASALPTTFFTCPHCGMTYELRPIEGFQPEVAPGPASASPAAGPSEQEVPEIMDGMPPVGLAGPASTDSMETDLNLAILDPMSEEEQGGAGPPAQAEPLAESGPGAGGDISLDTGPELEPSAQPEPVEPSQPASPQESEASAPSPPSANYVVLVECQGLNENARKDIAKIVAEARGIGIVKAERLIDDSGGHRLVLAKGLEESSARDYEVRLNSICPECATITRVRMPSV